VKKFIESPWFVDIVSGLLAGGLIAWGLIGLGFVK